MTELANPKPSTPLAGPVYNDTASDRRASQTVVAWKIPLEFHRQSGAVTTQFPTTANAHVQFQIPNLDHTFPIREGYGKFMAHNRHWFTYDFP